MLFASRTCCVCCVCCQCIMPVRHDAALLTCRAELSGRRMLLVSFEVMAYYSLTLWLLAMCWPNICVSIHVVCFWPIVSSHFIGKGFAWKWCVNYFQWILDALIWRCVCVVHAQISGRCCYFRQMLFWLVLRNSFTQNISLSNQKRAERKSQMCNV